jgi:hypothetical protein
MTRARPVHVSSAITACVTAMALATTSGCASLQTPAPYAADPRLDFPVFAYETDADTALATVDGVAQHEPAAHTIEAVGFGSAEANDGEGDAKRDEFTTPSGEVMQADGAQPRDMELDPRWRKVSPALFWTGIAVGSLGGAFLLGGGITGSVTQRQVRGAYDEGSTKADIDRLVARGEMSNDFVIAGSVLALAGYALAVVVAGIDEKRCGSVLRKARRRECERSK